MNTGSPPSGMWRFASLLPIADLGSVISLGEGDTPLIEAGGPTLSGLSLASVTMKAEHQNPTGSFKDRIAAVATALIREGGLAGTVGTSSGNGGAAIAAYGARAGFPVVLFTTSGIVDGKLKQILAHGATVHIVEPGDGSATEGVAPAIARLADETGWLPFLTGARYLPAGMQGAETIAFELAEQHPDADVVYVPVGGGGLLGSIWRGYQRIGRRMPRLVGVQPAGCPTLLRGVGGDLAPLPGPVTTSISGLQVAVLFDLGAVDAIRDGGSVTEVTDEQAWEAQRLLAREEGILVEPAGATALAGMLSDLDKGFIEANEHAVIVLSGAGHKDPAALTRLSVGNTPIPVTANDVASAFDRFRESL